MDIQIPIDLVREIAVILLCRNKTVTTMESCTAGLVAFYLTAIDGSSQYLKKSFITYSNEAKIDLGVSADTINCKTVYSTSVSEQMAFCARDKGGADYGIGVTGLCGKDDFTHGSIIVPAGTVYINIVNGNSTCVDAIHMDVSHIADRNLKRHIIACTALDLFLSHLKRG